jgi:two-component system, cell cycle sensor histidine kinase and response regulator CckA
MNMPTDNQPTRLLHVEDNDGDADLFWECWMAWGDPGLAVERATSVGVALSRVVEKEFDIILADLGLPDSQGIPTLHRLRSAAPAVPIVVLTGTDDPLLGQAALSADCEDYLPKTELTRANLPRLFRHAIERRKTVRVMQVQQARLRTSEARFRTMVETIMDGILIVDDRGIIQFANRATAALFECQRGELVGQAFEHPVPTADPIEVAIPGHDGNPRTVELRATELLWNDRSARLVVMRDRTTQRILEAHARQAQRLDAIGQLTGGVAHEINNLLNVIIANAGLILDAPSSDRAAMTEDLTEIQIAAERGSTLIRKLLGFSRRQRLEMKPTEVGHIITGLSSLARRLLPATIDLKIEVPPGPLFALADATALEQILVSIITNSRDAMPEGGTLVVDATSVAITGREIGNETGPQDASCARIRIADTGTGMDEETKERIFEPFFSTKAVGDGQGLGMSMVFGLVAQMDGHIAVESELGVGTTVDIYIPQTPAPPAAASRQTATVEPSGGSETILVVEDQPQLCRAAKRILTQYGYRVLTARDGDEALAVFGQHADTIALVITDVIMPGMTGQQLRDRLCALPHPPRLLFTSGYSAGDLRRGGALLGSNEPLLPKPWTLTELIGRVREALDAERPEPASRVTSHRG